MSDVTRRTVSMVLIAHPSPDLYGSDRVLLETVTALIESGRPVTVALPHHGPLEAELLARGARITIVPMLVLRKSLLRPAGLLTMLRLGPTAFLAAWRAISQTQPETVYVNTVTIPLWLLVGRLRRKKVVAHVHEAEEDVARVIRVALAAPLMLAHRVIVNSEATGRVLSTTIARLAGRIRLIYNGVPGPADPAAPRETITGGVRLVLVGRLSPRKGTDVALQALSLVRAGGLDASLDLVGSVFPGYEWFEQELRDLARSANLDGAVTFAGFRPSVWEALAEADIALVPSRVEPFGNAAVEAQLAHRPVIVSDAQGLVETVDSGHFGRVVGAGSAQALADAIVAATADWSVTRGVAAQALDHARAEFSTEQYQARIVEVIDGVMR